MDTAAGPTGYQPDATSRVSDIPSGTTTIAWKDQIMDIITTARTCLVAATFGAASLALSSCGDEVQPPAQDIGVELPEPETRHYEPACNTRAAVRPCPEKKSPAGSGTRNRIEFDDELARGR